MKIHSTFAATAALLCLTIVLYVHASAVPGPQTVAKQTAPAAEANDVKLSKYDLDVASPQIAIGRDGALNVAFIEATKLNVENFVFYRSSANGGKSWTETQNLSEDMPGYTVGPVRLAVDGQGRVYVVWRASGIANVSIDAHSRQSAIACNLFYRVLSGGQWSPILPINAPKADPQHQWGGSGSFFVGADPAGKVHVAYVLNTDVFHPELMFGAGSNFPQHDAGMGNGSIAQVDLDGAQHTKPREVFLTTVVKTPTGNKCDGLDLLDGYFDQSGTPHFVAQASLGVREPDQSRIVLCESGKQETVVTLPSPNYAQNLYPPCLLVDAQGHNHVIVNFAGGEQHSIRDYVAETGQYTVLKTEKPVNFPLRGFQAGQGAGGTGAVVMELDDSGQPDEGETWISVYDGKAWRPAIQVTQYKDKSSGNSKAIGTHSTVTTVGHWAAGSTAAATFDPQGHLVLIHEGDQFGNFALQGRGVGMVGAGTRRLNLLFHRF